MVDGIRNNRYAVVLASMPVQVIFHWQLEDVCVRFFFLNNVSWPNFLRLTVTTKAHEREILTIVLTVQEVKEQGLHVNA